MCSKKEKERRQARKRKFGVVSIVDDDGLARGPFGWSLGIFGDPDIELRHFPELSLVQMSVDRRKKERAKLQSKLYVDGCQNFFESLASRARTLQLAQTVKIATS